MQAIHPGQQRTRGREVGLERRAKGACDLRTGHRVGERFHRLLVSLEQRSRERQTKEQRQQEHAAPPQSLPGSLEATAPEDCGEVSEDENDRPRRAPDMDVATSDTSGRLVMTYRTDS